MIKGSMSILSVYVWTNIIKLGRMDTVMVGIWTKLVNQLVSWMAYCILVVSHQKPGSCERPCPDISMSIYS